LIAEPHLALDWQGVVPSVGLEPAVFLIHMRKGQPYLARTTMLKRRLTRLLAPKAGSRLLDLSGMAERIEIWYTPSRIEQALTFYSLARLHFAETYKKIVRLPSPPYLKVLMNNPFPRTVVTSRLSGRESLFFGPFRNRAEADRWQSETLDFFQIRRCEEDLAPNPDHPGCIYGEMNQCMRPCQDVVGVSEYSSEVVRLTSFIESHGVSLQEAIGHARDRASDNMEFEEAARQHKRFEKVEALLRLASEITTDIRYANGVSAVKAGSGVALYFLLDGVWQAPVQFEMRMQAGESMDRRLRQIVEGLPVPRPTLKEREEHLALLSRWFFSSWRDSEWLPFAKREEIPYRKLVRLISRAMNPVAAHATMGGNESQDPG
jgi:excinuclease ABC subunit C